ncbi:hypothetical protein E3N88_14336 [Mikania micrantha]|uniref:PHD-type domain-containing protein n=1 Tax=Mikania micrantha TaxID=192012 RepID=A0A5N6P3R8_9ASTR|nr:hypothetical protein E3N88_14336 [Mikania micrantha]
MSSLAERLRVRSDSRPRYSLDESDDELDLLLGKSKKSETVRENCQKEDSCNACGESENLLVCETCTYKYHPKCLLPPLKAPLPTTWRCPICVNPLNDIEKILDCEMRPTVADDKKGFIKAYKELPRLRTKVNNFRKQMPVGNNSEDDFVPIRPEYTMVDLILACRQDDEEKEYYVKRVGLSYDECYWESESDIIIPTDISSFQQQIENFNRLQSRYRKLRKQKSNIRDAIDSKNKLKEFQQFEKSPEFLPGGELHPYQLEGLNFLRFLGLNKHMNWEREFATWAPHMNVVMYVGTAAACAVIRIVDEGHRLKNKDSKLFSSLKQFNTRHRTLLTGTLLQNNLDELFMLMHFLDAGKFASLEEFQKSLRISIKKSRFLGYIRCWLHIF